MASNNVLFGNFSETEVEDLFQSETRDLEFVWQQIHSSGQSPDLCLEECSHFLQDSPSHGNGAGRDDPAVEETLPPFPSASVPVLELPDHIPPPCFGSGSATPNVPPTPPATPIDGYISPPSGTRSPSKLNVNAPAFVPANLSIIDRNNLVAESEKGNSNGDAKGASNDVSTNDRHMKVLPTNTQDPSAPKSESQGVSSTSTSPLASSPTPVVQTVAQSTPTVSTTNTENSLRSSAHHPTSTASQSTVGSSPARSKSTTPESVPSPAALAQALSSLSASRTLSSSQGVIHSPTSSDSTQNRQTRRDNHSTPTSAPQTEKPSVLVSTSPAHQSDLSFMSPANQTLSTATSTSSTSIAPTNESRSTITTITTPTDNTPPTPATQLTNLPVPSATVSPPKSKSWASIVTGGSGSGGGGRTSAHVPAPTIPVTQKSVPTVASASASGAECLKVGTEHKPDPDKVNSQLRSLGEQLHGLTVSHETVSILPRGLINPGNWCYIHAPLQALLSCPGVYNLLRALSPFPALSRGPSATPLTDSMVQFVYEFEANPKTASAADHTHLPRPGTKKKRGRPEFLHGDAFKPDYIYGMLHKIKPNLSFKGRQEDAEEFLGCVLDGLHEEMVSAMKSLQSEKEKTSGEDVSSGDQEREEEEGTGEEGEWEQVGPKNKSAITRQTSFSESPITKIFGGELRSAIHRQGAKESAIVEPFFSLQLDIQSEEIWTLRDALDALSMKETVQLNTGTHSEVEAHKRITLALLPPVLILHIKRFLFDKTGGSQKLQKHVQYGIDLEISKDLLAPAIRSKLSPTQRSYRLWAVVYHHGKFATGGHYTCDVYHPICGGWVRTDDNIVKLIPEELVLKQQSQGSNKVAYLLFYRRLDSIRT